MVAFRRKSNFATVVRFFNMIYTFKFSEEKRVRSIIFLEFYNTQFLLLNRVALLYRFQN